MFMLVLLGFALPSYVYAGAPWVCTSLLWLFLCSLGLHFPYYSARSTVVGVKDSGATSRGDIVPVCVCVWKLETK